MSQIVSRTPQFNGKDDRADAWIISCDAWDNANRPGLVLPLNPESLEIKLPVRGSESTMYGGKFITRRADPRTNSVFDFPSIQLRFNSGNIQPLADDSTVRSVHESNLSPNAATLAARSRTTPIPLTPLPSSAARSRNLPGRYACAETAADGPNATPGMYAGLPHIPVGVQNLYALLSLVNETWIIDANQDDVGLGGKRYTRLNRIRVGCSNLVFPGLVLYGFLDESGLSWSESAEQYNNFEVTMNLIVTHSTPRIRGVDFASLIAAYKSLFTSRTSFDAEYDISYKPYPQTPVMLDPIPQPPPTAQQQPLTWSQRIDNFSKSAFGNGRTGGTFRDYVGNGVGLATAAADRYADKALRNVDPAYAARVQAQRDAAQRDTDIANGTGTVVTDNGSFSGAGGA